MKKTPLFSYRAGKRMLTMLGLTLFVFAYFYLFILLVSGDLVSAIQDSPALAGASLGLVLCSIFLLCAILSPVIYLNAVKWMVRFLKMAFYEGICWLPGLNKLTPEYRQSPAYKQEQIQKLTKMQKKLPPDSKELQKLREQKTALILELQEMEERDRWLEKMEQDKELAEAANTKRRSAISTSLTRLADLEDGYYYDDEYYTGQEKEPNFLQKLLAFILGGFLTILLQIAKGIGYLLIAIGIPAISPVLVFLGLALISPLLTGHTGLMTAVVILLLVIFVLLFIVYPIFCLRLCPKPTQKPKAAKK